MSPAIFSRPGGRVYYNGSAHLAGETTMPETLIAPVRTAKEAATDNGAVPILDDAKLYLNREMSWLQFNRRVIDPTHPFPHLLNKSLNIAVLLRRPAHAEKLFAVVQVPSVLPRFVALPAERGHAFTALETIIRLYLPELFPGLELENATAFRV